MSDQWDPNAETEQDHSDRMHRENDPHCFADDDFGLHPDDYEDGEMEIECPHCDGDGQVTLDVGPAGSLTTDCPECGGTGWY
jgi:DnaJ-class molecular chaperone